MKIIHTVSKESTINIPFREEIFGSSTKPLISIQFGGSRKNSIQIQCLLKNDECLNRVEKHLHVLYQIKMVLTTG